MLPERDLEGSRDPRVRRGLGPRKGLLLASKLCTGRVVAPSTPRGGSTRRRSPPGPAAWSRGICGPGGEPVRRGSVRSEPSRHFPAFSCFQQGRFRPGAAEPRKGRLSARGPAQPCVRWSGAAFLPGCFPRGAHRPAKASALSFPAPRYLPRSLGPRVGPPGLLFPKLCVFKIKAGSQAGQGPDPPLRQGSQTQH